MTGRLASAGVIYSAKPLYVPTPDATAVAHTPWADVPWKALRQAHRRFTADLLPACLDPAVESRMRALQVRSSPSGEPGPYKPGNL
jgi:hypothetical protein